MLTVVYIIYPARLFIENPCACSQKVNLKSQLCRLQFWQDMNVKQGVWNSIQHLLALLTVSNIIHMHPEWSWIVGLFSGDSTVNHLCPQNQRLPFSWNGSKHSKHSGQNQKILWKCPRRVGILTWWLHRLGLLSNLWPLTNHKTPPVKCLTGHKM